MDGTVPIEDDPSIPLDDIYLLDLEFGKKKKAGKGDSSMFRDKV
jgi:hypothetical protein